MDDLPSPIVVEILTRLNDSTDLARCKLVSKTINTLSEQVQSINLHCSFGRYTKSRDPQTRSSITPFKTIFKNLLLNSRNVVSVSFGVDTTLRSVSYDDVEDEDDDLHMTDMNFVMEWLPRVCGNLRSILISDFWIQSCWRRTHVLGLLSSYCHSLTELAVKSAWLSVDGLSTMPTLTCLTLEFIRLDDENLNKVNDCFPSLRVLNLIGVGGLKEPKIHLLHLKRCQWTMSNAPRLVTIIAPNLVKLKLQCVKPRALIIEAPLLSDLHISLEKASDFRVQEFCNLKNLQLESTDLHNLLSTLPFGRTIKNLAVESLKRVDSIEMETLEVLFRKFPDLTSLTFGPEAWSQLEMVFWRQSLKITGQSKGLKDITAYLVLYDVEFTLHLILFVLEKYVDLSDMALLIHRNVDSNDAISLWSSCMAHCSRVRWRWGTWKEGTRDAWISDGI
ncbi:unnamed protein product [Ilex paraguariensis]|uniref:F-box domain-containing protein n=1 Tax=Ilex paraguariensis TaxID=185542 RepID=A0ABC8TC44_9AQUA